VGSQEPPPLEVDVDELGLLDVDAPPPVPPDVDELVLLDVDAPPPVPPDVDEPVLLDVDDAVAPDDEPVLSEDNEAPSMACEHPAAAAVTETRRDSTG
jgi:hypothetical protein